MNLTVGTPLKAAAIYHPYKANVLSLILIVEAVTAVKIGTLDTMTVNVCYRDQVVFRSRLLEGGLGLGSLESVLVLL